MRSCGGKRSAEDIQTIKKNREIETELKEQKKTSSNKFKLLLLGTGDAGKSTFCKQMQLIHKGGFNDVEVERFCEILRDNCLTSMHSLLLSCQEWGITFSDEEQVIVKKVLEAIDLSEELAGHIVTLSATDQINQALDRGSEIQISGGESGARYYFTHAIRFSLPDYKPTEEDILRAKMRTTGITEVNFTTEQNHSFTIVDVGGQRSERRKWLHCFGDVTGVIFLVAINEYDMVLEEDNKTNRMEESLKLFSKLTGSQWFDGVVFLLFFNKSDLFEEKIKIKPLKDFFEDFEQFCTDCTEKPSEGDESNLDYFYSTEYIKAQYVGAFNGHRLYPFLTCAIERKNCEKVWKAIRHNITVTALSHIGI